MNQDLIYLNGIDASTGGYLVPPMSASEAVSASRRGPTDRRISVLLATIRDALRRPFLGLSDGIDPTNVARAGWGIVLAAGTPPEVRDALAPLVARRRTQVPPDRCKVLEYRPGEAVKDWLKRHGVYPGSVSPAKVPYYLVLAGGPSAIPFEFQYVLDIEYAVGRLSFDRPEDYRGYAESVVDYEGAGAVPNAREVVYWGTRHAGDPATRMSSDYLIMPMVQGLTDGDDPEPPIAESLGYRTRCLLGAAATKANLGEALHAPAGSARPAMLFTASHGLGWPADHPSRRSSQGALLCQDWSGLGPVRPAHYLAADDIEADAHLLGLIAFCFACYGAGTPDTDDFSMGLGRQPVGIGGEAFLASLPMRLLSHPRGGALAVIGHVERASGFSIKPPEVGPQLVPFRNMVGRLLRGEPVGHATRDFSLKYATLSTILTEMGDRAGPGDEEVARIWLERNDARNYIVLGDPAVRLRADLLR